MCLVGKYSNLLHLWLFLANVFKTNLWIYFKVFWVFFDGLLEDKSTNVTPTQTATIQTQTQSVYISKVKIRAKLLFTFFCSMGKLLPRESILLFSSCTRNGILIKDWFCENQTKLRAINNSWHTVQFSDKWTYFTVLSTDFCKPNRTCGLFLL